MAKEITLSKAGMKAKVKAVNAFLKLVETIEDGKYTKIEKYADAAFFAVEALEEHVGLAEEAAEETSL